MLSSMALLPSLFGIFVLFALLSIFSKRAPANRALLFLRVFFPSWRFFEKVESTLFLEYRFTSESTWQPLFRPLHRGPFNWFFNPTGNLRLAFGSLLEQCASDMEEYEGEPERYFQSVSYSLLKALVEFHLRKEHSDPQRSYQFRLLRREPGTVQPLSLLTSEELSL